jgi:hypothetical protein
MIPIVNHGKILQKILNDTELIKYRTRLPWWIQIGRRRIGTYPPPYLLENVAKNKI